MTTTDKLPFPPNLPPLPEPPAGHEWQYRGTEWSSSGPGTAAYLEGLGAVWNVRNDYHFGGYKNYHYAEAVPVSTEPDYQDRAYQKKILDAAWEGVPCQYFSVGNGWIDEASFVEVASSVSYGYKIRIKPSETTKKRIPLTAEDIPAVCWVRLGGGAEVMIIGMDSTIVRCGSAGSETWESLMDWEYSPDRRNWKPCYVEVEG